VFFPFETYEQIDIVSAETIRVVAGVINIRDVSLEDINAYFLDMQNLDAETKVQNETYTDTAEYLKAVA
jgi:hypothetical protein